MYYTGFNQQKLEIKQYGRLISFVIQYSLQTRKSFVFTSTALPWNYV